MHKSYLYLKVMEINISKKLATPDILVAGILLKLASNAN